MGDRQFSVMGSADPRLRRLRLVIFLLSFVLFGFVLPSRVRTTRTWWAKKVTDDVYTAGCITQEQIQQAASDGFKSVISMFNQQSGDVIDEKYPTSAHAEGIAKEAGLPFRVILDEGEYDWMCLETVKRFSEAFVNLPKPILFHCMSSYSATFTTLLHYLNVSRHDVTARPEMDPERLLAQTASMGFDYVTDEGPMKMLQDIVGEEIVAPVRPNLTIPYWNFGFWPVKPVTQEWYASGRVQKDDLQELKDLGFDALVSVLETTSNSVKDEGHNEGDEDKNGGHEAHEGQQVVHTVVTPDRSLEKCTSIEFGDEAYSEEETKSTAKDIDLAYYSVVMGDGDFSIETWRQHRRRLAQIGSKHGAVLIHSRSGQRAVVLAILAAGCQYGYDADWAIDRLLRHGLVLTDTSEGAQGVVHTITNTIKEFVERHDWLTTTLYSVGITWERENRGIIAKLFREVLGHREEEC